MDILFEDNHLLVLNKPFGMPAQGDITGDESVLDWGKAYIKDKYQKPGKVYLALIHRLDRPAGGVMVLGKTSKAAARLSDQFQKKTVKKIYWAITEQVPDPAHGELHHYVRKLPDKNIMRAYHKPVHHSQAAHLDYRLLKQHHQRGLVEVRLHTGRRHQIRVQLASIGCTIQGDVKYGKSAFTYNKSIALLARSLTVQHPTKQAPLTFTAPLPHDDIWKPFG